MKITVNGIEYESCYKAEQELGISKGYLTYLAKRGTKSFTRRADNKLFNLEYEGTPNTGTHAKKVWVNDVEYESISAAERALGFPQNAISLLKRRNSNYYKPRGSDTIYEIKFSKDGQITEDNTRVKKCTSIIIDGVPYESIHKAETSLGLSMNCLRNAVANSRSTYKNAKTGKVYRLDYEGKKDPIYAVFVNDVPFEKCTEADEYMGLAKGCTSRIRRELKWQEGTFKPRDKDAVYNIRFTK